MIVLTVLKWIGIVLLWILLGILALALLILLVVLFVPFRYKVSVATGDGSGAKVGYGFHITWILHAVSVRKRIDSDQMVIRILGIPIKKSGGGSPPGEGASDEDEFDDIDELFDDEEYDTASETNTLAEVVSDEINNGDEQSWTDESDRSDETVVTDEPDRSDETVETDESEVSDEIIEVEEKTKDTDENNESYNRKKEEKISIEERIQGFKSKIKKKYQKFRFLFYKIHSIIGFVRSRATKGTIKMLLREVVKAIRYVGPRRFEGNIEFGTGDPGYTGAIMAGVSLMKWAYKKNVSIVPNFNELCLTGNATLWGRIRVVYFLRMAIRVWFNRDFRDLRKQYKEMKRDHKRKEKQLL